MKNQPGPVVCSLSETELRVREEALLTQFRAAVIAIEELSNGYAFRLPEDRKWIAIAAELITLERECCPFLAFELLVQPGLGPAILRMTGPPGAKEFLKTIFCP